MPWIFVYVKKERAVEEKPSMLETSTPLRASCRDSGE
jgi:hypothetical protein